MRSPLAVVVMVAAAAATGCLNAGRGGGLVGGGWSEHAPPQPGDGAAPTQELSSKPSALLSLSMAEGLEKDGKDADAVAYYEKARQLDPGLNDRAARRLAVLYDKLDDQARALAEFNDLLKHRPKDSQLLNDVGYSYYNRGQWQEAEAHLRRAVAADKANKTAWVNLGLALAQQGKAQESLEASSKAVTMAEAHANLGFVLAAQGKKAEAVAAYRTALSLEPALRLAQVALSKLEAAGSPADPPTLVRSKAG